MADGSGAASSGLAGPGFSGLDPRLLIWLSPAFPVGAFAFSHGLEQAAERGWVENAATLQDWIADLIRHGSLHNDLVLLAASWHVSSLGSSAISHGPGGKLCCPGEATTLAEINELAIALQPSSERRLETVTQGNSFMTTMLAAWPCEGLMLVREALQSPSHRRAGHSEDIAYPVAVGAACAAHGVRLESALLGYAFAFSGNLVSAAIRLSVVGQTDGQRVMAALMPSLSEAASRATHTTLDDLGGFTLRSDIAQLNHETQYSRLFRS